MTPRESEGRTEVQLRQAKPSEKQYKRADGRGLYVLVTPLGSKL